MWTRFLLKPFWVRVLGVMAVLAILEAVGWFVSWLGGEHVTVNPYHNVYTFAWHVVGLLIGGVLVAAFTNTSNGILKAAVAGLDPAQRSAAVDASFRGPVPANSAVRGAAIQVGQRRLGSAMLWSRMWLVLLGFAVVSAGAGLARTVIFGASAPTVWSPHNWVSFAFGLAVFLCLTVAAWRVPGSIKHCLQTLGQTKVH